MTTKVTAGDLLAKLHANLELHKKDYEEAKKGYRKEYIKRLESALTQAGVNGKDLAVGEPPIHPTSGLNPPESHEDDYLQAIAMLEVRNQDDEIELGWDQFRQFYQDNWDWKDQFIASNSMYTGR